MSSPWVLAALLILGIGGLVAAVAFSPVFGVKTIRISGNREVSRSELLSTAGIREGSNLLVLSAPEIEEALASSPWIADASVTKRLPSTLVIEVRERVPAGIVGNGRRQRLLVAGDGTVLAAARNSERLPVILGVQGGAAGERVPERAAVAARVAGSLDSETSSEVVSVGLEPDDSVRLRLRSGIGVLYGPPSQLEEKAVALAALLRWDEEHRAKIRSLDIRAPLAPSARVVGDDKESLEL